MILVDRILAKIQYNPVYEQLKQNEKKIAATEMRWLFRSDGPGMEHAVNFYFPHIKLVGDFLFLIIS
jgi:hypothetical protein